MAIKKINNYYLVDSLSDLNLITNPRLGAKCYVIETATNYTCNSEENGLIQSLMDII